jgi:hypothetical protein
MRDQPVSSSILHLFKVVAVLTVIMLAGFIPSALRYSDKFAEWVDANVKPFAIAEGKVTADFDQPYIAGDTNFLFIVDTTGAITNLDPSATSGILFMRDSLLVWTTPPSQTNAPHFAPVQSLLGFPAGTVNGDYFRGLIRKFLWVGLPFAFAVMLLFGALSGLLQAYLFTAIASFMERTLPAPLKFSQLLNIALHAITPAAIIFTAYSLFRLQGVDVWLVYLVAYGIFLVGATNSCRDRSFVELSED